MAFYRIFLLNVLTYIRTEPVKESGTYHKNIFTSLQNLLGQLESFVSIFSKVFLLVQRVYVSLADTGPCKYTTLYSKALLILFSTSDNTLFKSVSIYLYISDFDQLMPNHHAC